MSHKKPFVFRMERSNALIKHNQYRIEERYCDVTIFVQEKKFLAHRGFLASCSEVFEKMLMPGTIEYDTGEIHMHEQWLDPETFEHFLAIAYLGEVTITNENCHALCKLAHFFMLEKLLNVTEEYIGERIDTDNFFQLAAFAGLHQLKLLKKKIVEFLFRNFGYLTAYPEYLELSFDCLKFFLTGINERGARFLQEDLFCATMKWIEHDVNTRSVHLFELLNTVQLVHLSAEFLRTKVTQNELILNCPECCQLVNQTQSAQIGAPITSSSREGVIYAIGGYSDLGFYLFASVYDPVLNKWTLVRNFLDENRYNFRAVFYLDSVFVFGGNTQRGGHEEDSSFVERYCLDQSDQEKFFPLWIQQSSIWSVAFLGEKIYFIGKNYSHERIFSVLHRNSEEQTFCITPATMMNSTAMNIRLVSLGSHLYSLGGSPSVWEKTVERYCPRSDKWIDMPDMTYAHADLQAAALNRKLYVNSSAGFEMFDSETESWTVLPMPKKKNEDMSLVACCGKLYLIGGIHSQTVEEFDPDTRQWKFREGMKIVRNFGDVVAVGF